VRVAPNHKMAADGWVSSWGGGGDGDSGGQKCVGEGCGGGLVTGVDERRLAWPCAEESEVEKRRGERGGVERLFEAEVVRQGRGSGGGGGCRMEGGNGEERGGLGRGVGQRGGTATIDSGPAGRTG
jgi:hypothetical protein